MLAARTHHATLLQPMAACQSPDFSGGHSSRRSSRQTTKHSSIWLVLLCCMALLGWQVSRLSTWSQAAEAAAEESLAAALQDAAVLQEHHAAAPEVRKIAYPVWWFAPFYTGTGYSTEAISYVSALLRTNYFRREDIWISHSGDHIVDRVATSLEPETLNLLQEQEYNSLIRGRIPQEELDRPAIAVCHTFPDCWLLSKDENGMDVPVIYRVGRTMFETNSLPQHLVQHCNSMDEVWVPTEFNRATFTAAGVAPEKLLVVPQGIDAAQFDPDKFEPLVLRELPGSPLVTGHMHAGGSKGGSSVVEGTPNSAAAEEPYVFLSVFKWETRKGWDVLLEAYLHEFQAGEPVELHIVTKPFGKGRKDFREQVLAWLQRRFDMSDSQVASLPPVYVHAEHVDDATYPRLYVSSDCVVLPTRGEGWGRPQMEAMSLGKPVITTNWSGPTAYINTEVAYPLAIEGLTRADEDMNGTVSDAKEINVYFKGQQWAQPSVKHLKQLMRHVVNNPREAQQKGLAARRHIQTHFTPEVLAKLVMSEIMRIQDKLGLNRTVPPKEEREQMLSSKALCMAYPDLCQQGPAGIAEATRRAKSSFSQFRTNQNSQPSLQSGKMTVAEILALNRQKAEQAASMPAAGDSRTG